MCSIPKPSERFCDEVQLDTSNCAGITLNQALAGTSNDRIRITPTIVAPITELGYWSADPTSTYSQINSRSTKYPRLSGWESCAIPQQPGVYTMSEVRQPINATNGIAITPEFPAHTLLIQGRDNKIYYDTNLGINYVLAGEKSESKTTPPSSGTTASPPKIPTTTTTTPTDYCAPNIYNMYDPRLSGYGSDNRCYTDERLGQTRYFYDDVDAIRMPSYITRNKLDSCLTPYGDAYGDVNAGNLALDDVKHAAETSWTDSSLSFREDLMNKLMRKRNEEQVQRRMAPKYTYGTIRRFGY